MVVSLFRAALITIETIAALSETVLRTTDFVDCYLRESTWTLHFSDFSKQTLGLVLITGFLVPMRLQYNPMQRCPCPQSRGGLWYPAMVRGPHYDGG